jgi:glyoxylase-like metal-dependent hydrolase (beta-lactamase superfamily II)
MLQLWPNHGYIDAVRQNLFLRYNRLYQREECVILELVQLGERTWYVPGRVNVGYYEENGQGYLIDSGLDDDQGRKLLRLISEKRNTPLRAIINTHSNPDHIGGNAIIQKRSGCQVWANLIEGLLTERPSLESMMLWSAWPFKDIRGKVIEAKPSKVTFIESDGPIMNTALTAVPLPGHYFDMIGITTPDDVFFLGDALFDPSILAKYRFSVMLNVAASHATLDKIAATRARWFVPCHAEPTNDISELVRHNKEGLAWVSEAVFGSLADSALTREEILAKVALANGLEMDAVHLLLNLTSVSAHLTYLSEENRVEPFVRDCRLLWRRRE